WLVSSPPAPAESSSPASAWIVSSPAKPTITSSPVVVLILNVMVASSASPGSRAGGIAAAGASPVRHAAGPRHLRDRRGVGRDGFGQRDGRHAPAPAAATP